MAVEKVKVLVGSPVLLVALVFLFSGQAQGLWQSIHIEVLASACVAALQAPSAVNRFYNISGGEALVCYEVVRRFFCAGFSGSIDWSSIMVISSYGSHIVLSFALSSLVYSYGPSHKSRLYIRSHRFGAWFRSKGFSLREEDLLK